jgi:hypothetical protein
MKDKTKETLKGIVFGGLFLIVMAMMASFVLGGIENIGTKKQNFCINLPQTCSICTYNNISLVTNPDGTFALAGDYAMTKNGTRGYYYYFCDTDQIGEYTVAGYSDNPTYPTWSYVFDVTPSGNELTMPVSMTLILIIAIIIISGIFFLVITWFSNDQFVKTIFMCLAGFSIVVAIFFGMTIMFNLLPQFTGFMTAYNSFFYIMTIVILVIVFTLIVWVMVRTFKRMYKMRGMEYDN